MENNDKSEDDSSDTTESADMNYVLYDDTDEEEHNANSEDTGCHPLFKKCTSFKKHSVDDSKLCQTDLELKNLEELFKQIEAIEEKNEKHVKEIKLLVAENFELEAKNRKIAPIKVKVKRLESQNSVLKEKTIDIRKENDMLVEKVQSLQVRKNIHYIVMINFQIANCIACSTLFKTYGRGL